jgi:ADP-ribose pyrophosphatase YjhB (NUDIX family)
VSERAHRSAAEAEVATGEVAGEAERMTPQVAVGAFIFDDRGRVLLIERGQPPSQGAWTVPGGKLEPGETLAQAVAREVREETGLVAEIGPLVCVVERISEGYHYVILDYLARVVAGSLDPGSDVRAARFADDDELAKLPLTDGLMPIVARARAKHAAWVSRSP